VPRYIQFIGHSIEICIQLALERRLVHNANAGIQCVLKVRWIVTISRALGRTGLETMNTPDVYLQAVSRSGSGTRFVESPLDNFNLLVISAVKCCAKRRKPLLPVMLSTHSIPDCEHRERHDLGPIHKLLSAFGPVSRENCYRGTPN